MGQIQSLEEFLNLLMRRRWLIIAVTLLGMLLSAVYAKSRPDTYLAAAVIQVEVPTVTGVAEGEAQPSGAAQLLQTIEQRLTTREALLAAIKRHDIFARAPGLSPDEQIDLLRMSVRFENVASANGQTYGEPLVIAALIVYAELDNPDLAARVANDFAQGILDETSAGQRLRADQNVAFFREEESRIYQQLAELEAEIAAYKNTNGEALPAITDTKRDELVALDAEIRTSSQEKLALQGEAAEVSKSESLRETDRRLLEDLAARIDVIDAQIAANTARRAQIEAELVATPEVERVLSGYDRRLQQLQTQYEVSTQRMAEAETSQRLAERQQAERFTLLERAITPEYARPSGGKKLAIAGSVASLLLALTLAFMLDLLRPVVRTAAQMQRQLGLAPVISIPDLEQPKLRLGPKLRSGSGLRLGKGIVKMLDDPTKPLLGLPRFAVFATAATLVLMLAAAAIS